MSSCSNSQYTLLTKRVPQPGNNTAVFFRRIYLRLAGVFVFVILAGTVSAQQSIDKALNSDGTIKRGISGSFQGDGYQLSYGKNGEPVLTKQGEMNNNQTAVTWNSLGDANHGVNNTVWAFAVDGAGDVYIGGSFTEAEKIPANYVVKYSPASDTWSALGSGPHNGVGGKVTALAVIGSDLYVGGGFTTLGDGTTSANRIAKWNGSTWSVLPSGASNGVSSTVNALAVIGTDLYVGGQFTLLGDGTTSANRIAKWDGSAWSVLPSGASNGVGGYVNALAVAGTDLYVGGQFTLLGDGTTSAKRIAKWNGSTWSVLTSGASNGVNTAVNALAVIGTDLYVGGQFGLLGDGTTSAKRIAKWNGSTWSVLPSGASNGVDNIVYALAVIGTNLYVGGYFTRLGDGTTSAKYIAKWNGSTWSVLPSGASNGVNYTVYALATGGTDLYAGGDLTRLGNGTTAANRIAKWNGSAWFALNTGISNGVGGDVSALAVIGTDVYVGGYFTTLMDGTSAKRIAKWNGTAWSVLPSGASDGVNSTVYALAVIGTDLYVGGYFSFLGDETTSAKNIAKWNGSTWSVLPSGASNGVNNIVYALAVIGTDLYVGGYFSFLGDGTTSAKNIAKWNGSTWSVLPSGAFNGVDGQVNELAVSGTDIYVGGSFTTLGDGTTSANRIAKWDGNTWSTLASGASNGVNASVTALAVSGTDLYVGGNFTALGDGTTSANRIAKWNGSAWSVLPSGVSNGVNSYVYALAISGTDLYVGGSFTTLGDGTTSANRIAKWNGSTWSQITNGAYNGVSNTIYALCVRPSAGKLLAGGSFTTAGSIAANYVAEFSDPDNPLPVELSAFSASVSGNRVMLHWTTVTEVNNYGFEIQKSIRSGVSQEDKWKKIGFINGSGSSNTPKEYNFTEQADAGSYLYRLKMIAGDGTFEYSRAVNAEIAVPAEFAFYQNYPNPFNPSTTIRFSLPEKADVTLTIYNHLGQEVITLLREERETGYHTVDWNAANYSSGIYFVEMRTEKFRSVKKLMQLK